MKNQFLFTCLFFLCQRALSQKSINNDTIYSNIVVTFSKVKQSSNEASTAQMVVNYLPSTNNATIAFEVPSFWFRHNTSKTDYCIIEAAGSKIKLQNQEEANAKGKNKNIYKFLFLFNKDTLLQILSSNLKKITFYFTPNKNIEKYLLENEYLNKSFDSHLIKISKKTLKFRVSKPDKIQYKELITWLEKL